LDGHRITLRRAALTAALGVIAVTGTVVAGTGPGGIFNLGVVNEVSSSGTTINTTTLTGLVNGDQLHVQNTSTSSVARAVSAISSSSAAATVRVENKGGGPALSLIVPARRAPMAVSAGAGRVVNLDVDRLDGLDSTQLQRRVAGTCPAGSAVSEVTATGGVTCEQDDVDGGNAQTLDGVDSSQLVRSDGVIHGKLRFGSVTRQMLDLWGADGEYGIGVQNATQYQRSSSGFAWYKGGTHSGVAYDAGTGGKALLTLDEDRLHLRDGVSARLELGTGKRLSVGGSGSVQVDANGIVGGRFAITEEGDVGIGTASPSDKLTVNGTVRSASGGFKFPNGSVQESAAGKSWTTYQHVTVSLPVKGSAPFVVRSLTLPRGTYLLEGSVQLANAAEEFGQENRRQILCTLGGDRFHVSLEPYPWGRHAASWHAVKILNEVSNKVELACETTNGGTDFSRVSVFSSRLTAIQLGGVEVQ
jgi:hypothetical protein